VNAVMLLELGPVPAEDLRRWSGFARRVLIELRTNPEVLEGVASDDFLTQWSRLIDAWSNCAADCGCGQVRWSCPLDDEMAEFLLHGLERCFHSEGVTALMSPEEVPGHRQFTLHVIQAFIDGLTAQGLAPNDHFCDQVRANFGGRLEA
jgi:hypothetical protein